MYSSLTDDDIRTLQNQRLWIRGIILKRFSITINDKCELVLLQRIIDENILVISSDDTLNALGTCFGDTILSLINAEWCIVNDELGIRSAIKVIGKNVAINPGSMLINRRNRGDKIDFQSILQGLINWLIENDHNIAKEKIV